MPMEGGFPAEHRRSETVSCPWIDQEYGRDLLVFAKMPCLIAVDFGSKPKVVGKRPSAGN
jgi:hypothetical protein